MRHVGVFPIGDSRPAQKEGRASPQLESPSRATAPPCLLGGHRDLKVMAAPIRALRL